MDNIKIAFSINGDPTIGYKNIVSRGFLNFESQMFLISNASIKDGSDTYIAYVTEKIYELHIVTSPSRIGGLQSRGAFNVGVAIPKGYEIQLKNDIGTPISISFLVRELRERFAKLAMLPNEDGKFFYDERSLESAMLKEELSDWLDQKYQLVKVSRKEIVMKGDPDKKSRAKLSFSSVEKIDQFFYDPNFRELIEYGSVEAICSNVPDTLNLEVPRKPIYTLQLVYRKGNSMFDSKNYVNFFKSNSEKYTLPIGEGLKINPFEEFKCPVGSIPITFETLRAISNPNILVDDENELVKIVIDIVPRVYNIEIKWKAEESYNSKTYFLQNEDKTFLSKMVLFVGSIYGTEKKIIFDESSNKYFLILKGKEVAEEWHPQIARNKKWILDKKSDKDFHIDANYSNDEITLSLVKRPMEIIINLNFISKQINISPIIKNDLLANLKIEPQGDMGLNIESPKINRKSGSVTFNELNIGEEYLITSQTGQYEVRKQFSPRNYGNSQTLNLNVNQVAREENVSHNKSPYSVVLKVFSMRELPRDSYAAIVLYKNGPEEKITLNLTNKKWLGYEYDGVKAIDPKYKDADIILINGRKYNNYTASNSQKGNGDIVETIKIKMGYRLPKNLVNALIVSFVLVLTFLIGSFTQMYCGLPFTQKNKDLNIQSNDSLQIDSLKNEISRLTAVNDSLKDTINKKSEIANGSIGIKADIPINKKDSGKSAAQLQRDMRIGNEILKKLKDIDVNNAGNRTIASHARDIVKSRIDELSSTSKEYKWFQENIINAIDAAAAANVKNMVKKDWNPFLNK